ncbi:MAG: hypothetical protein ABEJ34_02100 [Haloferacaceae archaeon]
MADRARPDDTSEDGSAAESSGTDAGGRDGGAADARPDDPHLPTEVAADLRRVADRIDEYAGTLPFDAARHHARIAARAAREAADGDAPLPARRAAVGELVTALRTAADEAEATRAQYRLLELLYEEALPATRSAGTALYG